MINEVLQGELRQAKMHSRDRVLVLKVMDDKKPKSAAGLIDPRIFSGTNNLHVKCDPITNLWWFEYDSGIVPLLLKQRFTNFNRARKLAEEYLKRRNIEIVEVKDNYA